MTRAVPGAEDATSGAASLATSGHGHPTHDELVAAVAAILAVSRPAGATVTGSSGEAAWRAARLAALGLTPRR